VTLPVFVVFISFDTTAFTFFSLSTTTFSGFPISEAVKTTPSSATSAAATTSVPAIGN
jgi:hypothetical protein